jgi:hypothetical protein
MPWRSNGLKRLTAIVKQLCPRCLQGQVFATLFRMHEQCPVCGLRFEREPGYFTGAMYLRYIVGVDPHPFQTARTGYVELLQVCGSERLCLWFPKLNAVKGFGLPLL